MGSVDKKLEGVAAGNMVVGVGTRYPYSVALLGGAKVAVLSDHVTRCRSYWLESHPAIYDLRHKAMTLERMVVAERARDAVCLAVAERLLEAVCTLIRDH